MDYQPDEILEKIFILSIDYRNLGTMRASVAALRISKRWKRIIDRALHTISEIGDIDIKTPVIFERREHNSYWGDHPIFYYDNGFAPAIHVIGSSIYIRRKNSIRLLFRKESISIIEDNKRIIFLNKKLEVCRYRLPNNIRDEVLLSRSDVEDTILGPMLLFSDDRRDLRLFLLEEGKEIFNISLEIYSSLSLFRHYFCYETNDEKYIYIRSLKNLNETIIFPRCIFTSLDFIHEHTALLRDGIFGYLYDLATDNLVRKLIITFASYCEEVIIDDEKKIFDTKKGNYLCHFPISHIIKSSYKKELKYHLIISPSVP